MTQREWCQLKPGDIVVRYKVYDKSYDFSNPVEIIPESYKHYRIDKVTPDPRNVWPKIVAAEVGRVDNRKVTLHVPAFYKKIS